jgi:hypothetical protein
MIEFDTLEKRIAEIRRSPVLVKISVVQKNLEVIDRYRTTLAGSVSRPECIRTIVEEFVSWKLHLYNEEGCLRDVPIKAERGSIRKEYIKVCFDYNTMKKIDEVASLYSCNRQTLISKAIQDDSLMVLFEYDSERGPG